MEEILRSPISDDLYTRASYNGNINKDMTEPLKSISGLADHQMSASEEYFCPGDGRSDQDVISPPLSVTCGQNDANSTISDISYVKRNDQEGKSPCPISRQSGTRVPHLVMSNSILDQACPHFQASKLSTQHRVRFQDSTDSEDEDEGIPESTRDILNKYEPGSRTGHLELQTTNDSHEEHKMRTERRPIRRKLDDKEWNVVVRMDWRVNTVDKRTIYSDSSNDLLRSMEDVERQLLPPLDCSPRMAGNVPDSQDLLEKFMVIKHNLSVGQKTRYKKDRVVLPTVYTNFFSCPERKKEYINTLWREHYSSKHQKKADCSQYKKRASSCTFCEVMGSKYCSFCREFKNRHFALSYEENYLPSITRASGGRELRNQLVSPQLQPLLPQRGHKRHKKRDVKTDRLLMPITYIPQDRDQI